MIAVKIRSALRFLALLGISGVTVLVLLGAITAIHHQGDASLAPAAHATTVRPTCATTRGTQQDVCEQQDPVAQGCTQDAHALEKESVYTDHNVLIGEVALWHSALCKTFWVSTVASANVKQVQAVDAIISFSTGKREVAKKTMASNGQPITAMTHMLFVRPAVVPTDWGGTFHLSGQTQPITVLL